MVAQRLCGIYKYLYIVLNFEVLQNSLSLETLTSAVSNATHSTSALSCIESTNLNCKEVVMEFDPVLLSVVVTPGTPSKVSVEMKSLAL